MKSLLSSAFSDSNKFLIPQVECMTRRSKCHVEDISKRNTKIVLIQHYHSPH